LSAAIGEMLPLAIAIAISPISIIALVLILISQRARSNGPAYFLGWILGLAVAVTVTLVLVSLLDLTPPGTPTTLASLLKLLLGALLLYLGVRQWRHLPKPGQEPSLPRWMASIDSFTPIRAFGLAVLLSSVSNFAIIIAAALTISRANLDLSQKIVTSVIFIVISSLLVAFIVIYYYLAHKSAARTLDTWKAWLLTNNALMTSVLLIVVGTLLVGKGIGGLNLFG